MHEGDKANLVDSTPDGVDPNLQDGGGGGVGVGQTASTKRSGVRCPNSAPKGMTLIVLISVIFSAAVTIALILTIIFGEPQVQKLGGVAADTSEASHCGLEMLSTGGSAVDAAVAAALCGAVVQYPVTGLGGGGLLLVHDHRGDKTTLFDFLSAAPRNFTSGLFNEAGAAAAIDTALGTGVPGFVRGLAEAHRRFGKLKWSSLVGPAIHLASAGFQVSADLNRLVTANSARLVANRLLKSWFLTDGGLAKPVGATVTMPELALALTILRDQGPAAMYTGALAAEFLIASTASGGRLSKADLAEYQVLERPALVGHYRNFTLRTFPPPALGGVYTLLVAQVLAGYPGVQSATVSINSTQFLYHRAAEAMKLALGAVQPLGEGPTSTAEAVNNLATPRFADELRARIQDTKVIDSTRSSAYSTGVWPPVGPPASSQLVAVDNDELYVAMETSVNTPFATRLTTTRFGLLLNNALAGFAPLSAGGNHSNAPAPGRRPATLMSPGFAFNPRQRCGLRFAFGASNSSSVPGISAWLIARMSDLASDPAVCPGGGPSAAHRDASSRQPCLPASAAVSSGRVNPLLPAGPSPPGLEAEIEKVPAGVGDYLSAMGHNLSPSTGLGRAQVIAMDMYSLTAQSDTFRSPGAKSATLPQRGA